MNCKCQTHLGDINKADKHTNCVCKADITVLQGHVDVINLQSLFLMQKNTHIYKHSRENVYQQTHTRTDHIHDRIDTHTHSPPTLCKSLATATINLDETTPWQREAFIPFPGGVIHSRGSTEGQIKLSKEADVSLR